MLLVILTYLLKLGIPMGKRCLFEPLLFLFSVLTLRKAWTREQGNTDRQWHCWNSAFINLGSSFCLTEFLYLENSAYLSPYLTGMLENSITYLRNISIFLEKRHSLHADLKSAWVFARDEEERDCFVWFWGIVLQFKEIVGPFWAILWSWSFQVSI